MKRKLIDRYETYTAELYGKCQCGKKVNKVLGSDQTMWKNGDRYYEPGDKRAVCIFRCDDCGSPIDESFVAAGMDNMGSSRRIMMSALLRDYERTKKLPSVNELLDWRNRLEVLRDADNENPIAWYDNEIKACDELLKRHSS